MVTVKLIILMAISFNVCCCVVVEKIGPSIPTYEASHNGVCQNIQLFDSEGRSYPAVGLMKENGKNVIFVSKYAEYDEGKEYSNYVGMDVFVTGQVYANKGDMISLGKDYKRKNVNSPLANYIGLKGWTERLNKDKQRDRFDVIRVDSISTSN